MFLQVTRNLLSSSGLPSAKTAAEGKAVAEEEEGDWCYLVVDAAGIRARSSPSYDKTQVEKRGRHMVGEVVAIDRRRKAGWTRWLRVRDTADWLFDVSPKDNKVRMTEVEVLQGEWLYEVLQESKLASSLADVSSDRDRRDRGSRDMLSWSPKKGKKAQELSPLSIVASETAEVAEQAAGDLRPGDLVTVVERVRPLHSKGAYLRLAHGGWAVDFDGRQQLRRMSDEADDKAVPGLWHYVVLDPKGITLRSKASCEKSAKLQARLEEGQLVRVTERRSDGLTTFLSVAEPSGWAFDQAKGKAVLRMAEASVEDGEWWYHVTDDKGCGLRRTCSTSHQARCGFGPQKGALVKVVQRVQVGDTIFMRLPEGQWIFDRKHGKRIVAGPCQVQERNGLISTVTASSIQLRQAPTDEGWARTNLVMLAGAKVSVDRMVELSGVWWSFVRRSQGSMEGWTLSSGLDLAPNLRLDGAARWTAC